MNGNDRKSQKFPAVASCVAAIPQLTHRLSCPAVITTRGLPRTPIPGGDSLVLTAEQAVSHRSIHPRPSANAAPMPHMQLEHFFSYDSDTTIGTIGTNSATKNLFLATDVFRLSATISTTTVKPEILRTDQENQSQIQIAPFSRPTACPQSEHRRKLAQSCGRNKISRKKSAGAAKTPTPDTNHLLLSPLFRPQSEHCPKLAQSYSRNNRNTMRAEL